MHTEQMETGYRYAQWRMLLATMCCYLFYYTGRHNFGWAINGMSDGLNLTKTDVGWISGSMLACNGLGQAINGNLGDKFGARRLMALGALLSCIANSRLRRSSQSRFNSVRPTLLSSSLPKAGPCVSPFAPIELYVQRHAALLMLVETDIIESWYY